MDGSASIIIPTFEGSAYIETCLRCVMQQLRSGDELIVVDNASSDGTAGLVAARFPAVRLVRNATNQGFAAACNQAAALACGQVLVFLNQDTRVAPGWLASLVRALDGGDLLVTSQVRLMSHPGKVQACGQDVHFSGLVFGRGYGRPAEEQSEPTQVGAVSGASFAIRRELWQALGGLDEGFFMYYEETDLCWRARLAGCRALGVPESVAFHDYRPGRPGVGRFYHSARNRQQLLLKNWRWRTLLLLGPGLLLAELVEWGLALRLGYPGFRAKARALVWVVRHFGEIRRRRAAAQAGRTATDAEILAERSWRLAPVETAPGSFGNAVLRICNGLLWLDYRMALAACRRLGC